MASETAKAAHVLAALGTAHGTRAQTALRFSLAEPRFACTVFGLARLAHLDEALAAADLGPLPASALDALEQAYASFR